MTGAGSGIGRATAWRSRRMAPGCCWSTATRAALARAAESVRGARSLRCDVSDADAMQRLADEVLASEGVPDIVINNAGIAIAGPFLKTSIAEWRRIVDINLLGVVHGCRLFGEAMVARGGGGQIVNTASAAAFMASKGLPAYSATEGGGPDAERMPASRAGAIRDRRDRGLSRLHRDQHHPCRPATWAAATPTRTACAIRSPACMSVATSPPSRSQSEIVDAIGADRRSRS